MTTPKRPSRAAQQRAYERDLAAWRAEDRAHAWRLAGYVCTGLAVWWILDRDPGGSPWWPRAGGLAVALAVGNIFELRRGSG